MKKKATVGDARSKQPAAAKSLSTVDAMEVGRGPPRDLGIQGIGI